MNLKKKMSKLILLSTMIVGMFASTVMGVNAATNAEGAPTDWAFDESSIPLHDAILAKYPTVDGNGDGYITKVEAETWNGSSIYFDSATILAETTMNGLQYFIKITALEIVNNNLVGSIPTDIDNLIKINKFNLSNNKLNGELPTEIGNLPTTLKFFSVLGNQLTGQIPSSIGNLTSLNTLYLKTNKFSGEIPDTLGSLTNLQTLTLSNNNFTGPIPATFKDLSSLTFLELDNNPLPINNNFASLNLTASELIDIVSNEFLDDFNNLPPNAQQTIAIASKVSAAQSLLDSKNNATNIVDNLFITGKIDLATDVSQSQIDEATVTVENLPDSATKTALLEDIALAQKMLDTKTQVDALLTADSANLTSGVTQVTIDNAQIEVNSLPNGSLKDELQKKIDIAQALLDATNLVDNLLTDNKTRIGSDITQVDINNAQTAVDKLPVGTTRTELQADIYLAQQLLDAKNKVYSLLTDDNANLAKGITQEDVNSAQIEVNKLPNGSFKDELQAKINIAQQIINAQKDVPIQKPSKSGSSTETISSINTGDKTINLLYMGLLVSAMITLGLLAIRRKKVI